MEQPSFMLSEHQLFKEEQIPPGRKIETTLPTLWVQLEKQAVPTYVSQNKEEIHVHVVLKQVFTI